jgi:hypothetical protein
MNSSKIVLLLFLTALLPGCSNYYKTPSEAANYYYLNRDKNLTAIGRVAIVELDNNSSYPQVSADITESLYQALQKKQVFGLTVIRQTESSWRSLQLAPDSTYTLEQLSAIRRTLKCGAIMTGTITQYQPYPHMVVGLRLRILDLMDGQLIWALEQVWDSADKTTEHRVKDYFQHQKRSGFAPLREQLAVISPLEFIKFVTYETAETL